MITITRRQALKGMAGMGMALVATACGAPAAAPTAAPKPGATEAPAPAPAAEKVTLRWDVSDATDVPTMLKLGAQGAALFAQKFPNIEVKPEPPPENQQQQILT
jgi:ABC-type glycerol-3-phosphate transport system substrate-binding protein